MALEPAQRVPAAAGAAWKRENPEKGESRKGRIQKWGKIQKGGGGCVQKMEKSRKGEKISRKERIQRMENPENGESRNGKNSEKGKIQ